MKASFSEKIEIPYAASHQYASKGSSEKSIKYRAIVSELKRDGFYRSSEKHTYIPVVGQIVETISSKVAGNHDLARFLNSKTLLVPIPGHAPIAENTLKESTLIVWPARSLAQRLCEKGLGIDCQTLLRRTVLVKKSSVSESGERPQPEDHFASLSIVENRSLISFNSITLIDDVITRGSSFVGAYLKIREVYPEIPVYCFAPVRTISSGEVSEMIFPVTGTITFESPKLKRTP